MRKISQAIMLIIASQYIASSKADELKIHVITPRHPINWSSPRTLAITSALDSVGDDYAPIGHFAVEINCSNKNKHGINSVLTGMERENKELSRAMTLKKKLGLGSLTYPFKGALQAAVSSYEELNMAIKDKRIRTISIPTSKAHCDKMLEFVDQWIEHGSYQIYGGGNDVSRGEGAGCADFAMELFEIATEKRPPHAWIAAVHIPLSLIGDGKHKEIDFLSILVRFNWAGRNEPSTHFRIADTNFVTSWLLKRMPPESKEYQYTTHLFPRGVIYDRDTDFQNVVKEAVSRMTPPEPLKPFTFHYSSPISPFKLWNKIERR